MEALCNRHGLFRLKEELVRVPFVVKGRLVLPPEVSPESVREAFSRAGEYATLVKMENVQVLREPVIQRSSMKYTGEYIYQVMPAPGAYELIEPETATLADGLYRLGVDDILDYIESIVSTLLENYSLAMRVLELLRRTSEFPEAFLDDWINSTASSLNRETARQMIDSELSFMGKPGSQYLEGWVEVPGGAESGWLRQKAVEIFGRNENMPEVKRPYVRAMPTRQLHITAGNAPEVPLVSALRAVLTKSAAVIKMPYGATLSGAFFAMAAVAAAPDHPITRHLSMVYWQGGDEAIEAELLMSGAFDRLVVWGGHEAIASMQSRTHFARAVYLNPRYGVSFIGNEAFSASLEEVAMRASLDVMIHNQKACSSSLVHYVEGSAGQAVRYAGMLQEALYRWDEEIPNFLNPLKKAQLKRMRRGRYIGAEWLVNTREGEFSSGVVVIQDEFDILDHPMCRLVVVKPVDRLEGALKKLNQFVSTAGVYPEERRLELRDRMLSRGVSSVLSLGHCENLYSGMPHDGMLVLGHLVDWKNS